MPYLVLRLRWPLRFFALLLLALGIPFITGYLMSDNEKNGFSGCSRSYLPRINSETAHRPNL